MSKFHVGQQLWYVPFERRGNPRSVNVTVIGRKWVTLEGRQGRFDESTMLMDGNGYSSPGRVYMSQEEHLKSVADSRAWDALTIALRGMRKPDSVSMSDIQQVAKLLGIEIGELK